jgi:hypothetical protein
MTKKEKVELLVLIMTTGFFLAVGYCYVMGMYLGKPWPYNTFLFFPQDVFADFMLPIAELARGPYLGQTYAYPPLMKTVFLLFSLLPHYVDIGLMFLIFLSFYCVKAWRYAATEGSMLYRLTTLLALTLMSYPVLYTLDRGNSECLVFITVFYACERMYAGRDGGGTLALGASAALKLFPAACFPLALGFGGLRGAAKSVAWFLGLSAGGLLLLSGIYAMPPLLVFHNMLGVMHEYNRVCVLGSTGLIYAHSLWCLMKIAVLVLNRWFWHATLDEAFFAPLMFPYFLCACALFALGGFYVAARETVVWRKIAVCIIMMDLLPYTSPDYKLLYITIPLLLFLNEKPGPYDAAYTVIFGLLLIPKNYMLPHKVMLGIPLNPLLMLALAAVIVRDNFREEKSARRP